MEIDRREFLKMSAAAAALMAIDSPVAWAAKGEGEPERWVKGVCRYCGTGCGVLVGVKGGKVVTVKGDPNNHNAGVVSTFLCEIFKEWQGQASSANGVAFPL